MSPKRIPGTANRGREGGPGYRRFTAEPGLQPSVPGPDWLLATIRDRSRVRELDEGQALFRQGDKAFAIFEVERGRLRMVRNTAAGRSVVLHTARTGEFFAEAALFATTYHCDAVAAAPSRVRVYPKRELLAAFRSDPALAERFMAVLARQIISLRASLEERNIRSASERVLHHLALAAGPEGRPMPLEGTLMDLAVEIGLTHEALYRTLAKLEKEGAIRRGRTGIALRRGGGK
jgi:CRP/FNR family transcriptional regulator, dissimilatory nitrate respiration regulator